MADLNLVRRCMSDQHYAYAVETNGLECSKGLLSREEIESYVYS